MKVAVRGGHNFSVPGASGLIDETTEDRKVKDNVIVMLRNNGVDVLDCTAPDSCNTQSSDLVYGVDKANNWGADLFISIHFNNAYNTYKGAIGTETVVYSGFDIAERIVNNIANLGFINRGMKGDTRGLYELRHTDMKAIIVESCFVEATEDVALYRKVGPEGIAKAIVEGILNSNVTYEAPAVQNNASSFNSNSDNWVSRLQEECNVQGFSNQVVDGIPGHNTLNGCPTLRQGAQGNITKLLQEKLVSLGFDTNGVDGIFGNGTDYAVRAFQGRCGLIADGIVGSNTWRKLLEL